MARGPDPFTARCAMAAQDCACEGVRRAARAISSLYEGALSDLGLTATQLAILFATRIRGAVPLTPLAKRLGLDRTSLYRAVRPLARRGHIRIAPGRNQRERVVVLTPKGERLLGQALPVWEHIQQAFVGALGARSWAALSTALRQVPAVVEVLQQSGAARRRRRARRG